MKNTFLLLLSFLFIGFIGNVNGQCPPETNGVSALILPSSGGGTDNRSALVWNPNASYYYSLNAGSGTYPADVYNATGALIQSNASGNSWRGVWWNPSTSTVQGNQCCASPVESLNLVAGLPSGGGTFLYGLSPSPANGQSCVYYNADDDEIINWNGFNPIVRYSATTGAQVGTLTLTGGTGTYNTTSVIYVSCPGYEIGLYDYTAKRVDWFNKTTGAFAGSTQLPGPVFTGTDQFNFSYSNGMIWLYDRTNDQWEGFSGASAGALAAAPAIPTVSEWGLVLFCLILLNLGLLGLWTRRKKPSTVAISSIIAVTLLFVFSLQAQKTAQSYQSIPEWVNKYETCTSQLMLDKNQKERINVALILAKGEDDTGLSYDEKELQNALKQILSEKQWKKLEAAIRKSAIE